MTFRQEGDVPRAPRSLARSGALGMLPIAGALALSWSGVAVHNSWELGLAPWRPESSLPAVVAAGVAVGYARRSGPGWARAAAGVGWLHLLGGAVVTVLPLGLLPFQPEQSLGHYAAHLLCGLAQVPLILLPRRAGSVAA